MRLIYSTNHKHPAAVVFDVLAVHACVQSARLTHTTSLEDLDLDSLELIEAMLEIEDRLGISLCRSDYSGCKTVAEIVGVVDRAVARTAVPSKVGAR